jgi:hypothetical protein
MASPSDMASTGSCMSNFTPPWLTRFSAKSASRNGGEPWKLKLIEEGNPVWRDLYNEIL